MSKSTKRPARGQAGYVVPIDDVPRHASSLPRTRARFAVAIAAMSLVVMLAGTGLFAFTKLSGNINTEDISSMVGNDRPTDDDTADDPYVNGDLNILVMGSDSREGTASYGAVEGARSDTTAIVHVSADRKDVEVVSIPRDSMVAIPSCKTEDGGTTPAATDKFNAAFSKGGPACTMKTVESLTDIRIDNYVVVDFNGFQSMVDGIGGVEVCLAESIHDRKAAIDLSAGRQTLDGKEALGVVRSRHSTADGSDLSRINRQQQFLAAMFHDLTAAKTLSNPTKLYSFLDAATSSVTTDPELGDLNNMRKLGTSMAGLPEDGIKFVTVPNGDSGDGSSVLWKQEEAESLFDAIRGKKRDDSSAETDQAESSPAANGDAAGSSPEAAATAGSVDATPGDEAADKPADPPSDKSTGKSTDSDAVDESSTDTSAKAKDSMICEG
ncbi:LCP family protein [Saxibacter everestensis]|uniref:LCP family protein n=1 Tax=Saxibacter everestensis TaxID=2909229 RepID=A0ABY8QVW4_9MICO|nr:LCP family protein [Brevibacteriaceae bacterium ZFBP1038]